MNLRNSKPHGITIIEVTIALAITGVVVTAVVQGMIGLRTARRSYQQRTLANQEVANLMERVHVLSWDELAINGQAATPMPSIRLSSDFLQAVPSANLTKSVVAVDEPAEAVKISLTIDSVDAARRGTVPLASLTAWRFRIEEGME